MLSVAEAQKCILEQAQPLTARAVSLDKALGMVLAEDVASDLDMPPFDKALMDGYAVRCADLAQGSATLEVIEEVPAGQVPRRPLGPGEAVRIMTGAPIPVGCDAVVMVERSRAIDERHVHLEDRPTPERNILRRGQEMRNGMVVLRKGQVLRPQEIGLLASVGKAMVMTYPAPQAAILPTGDELVAPSAIPGPGQIRNSNGPMLLAQVMQAGFTGRLLNIAPDDPGHLRTLMAEGLRDDVLILTGGVSAGKLDLVPGVLAELGVKILVHHVAMKPGKPMLFGVLEPQGSEYLAQGLGASTSPGPSPRARYSEPSGSTMVFGLPGNPVSSWVCFELFVAPALRRLAGHAEPGPHWKQAVLEEDYRYKSDRPTYHPALLRAVGTTLSFRPVPWLGSPDLAGATRANGLVLFPVGDHHHRAGQVFEVLGG